MAHAFSWQRSALHGSAALAALALAWRHWHGISSALS
jgi:hypothetical protein